MPDTPATGDSPVQPAGPGKNAGMPGDRVLFRLAMFAAVLVVVVSAGFAIGRIGGGSQATPIDLSAQPIASQPMAEGGHGDTAAHGDTGTPAADTHAADTHAEGNHADGATAPHDDTGTAPHVHDADGTVAAATAGGTGKDVGGLAVSSAGLTLVPESATFTAGRSQPFRFRITGADGKAVTTYNVVHDKPLHLVVVRRDLSGYQHVHPAMSAEGVWSIDLTLADPGSWRAYADFTAVVAGQPTAATLGVDLNVAGNYAPRALPAPARQATAAGFTVNYEGAPQIGATQPLLVTVTRAGAPATLEPYLGAYGHLVVLREGDLGYVHVHPEPELVGGAVKFWLAAPGPGRYRMFFDFQVAGQVHTAAFTSIVS